MQITSIEWQDASASVRRPFIAQYNRDKARFEKEMANFVASSDQPSKLVQDKEHNKEGNEDLVHQSNNSSDQPAPKRPPNSFILFTNFRREQLMLENPSITILT